MSKKMKYRDREDLEERDRRSRQLTKSYQGLTRATSQAEKENCDINILVRRFGAGNVAASANLNEAGFGEWDSRLDLQTAMQVTFDARHAFNSLPAEIREYFNNDPTELVAALQDKEQKAELIELGLLKAPATNTDGSPPKAETKTKAKPSKEGTGDEPGTGGEAS